MLFTALTVLGLAGLGLYLTRLRWAEHAALKAAAASKEGSGSPASAPLPYGPWLTPRVRSLASKGTWMRAWAVLAHWKRTYYPGWTKWIFYAFGLSAIYLAATGLFYAVFVPRGMFGAPLVGHMVCGGLFAASLAALLLLRARDYAPGKRVNGPGRSSAPPILKGVSNEALRAALFWAIAALGFVLIVTALGSMLPVFTFDAQRSLIFLHRYAALGIVLSAIVFADIAFVPAPRA
jgi:hypothetical protein